MNNREEVPLYWEQKNQITSNVNMKKLYFIPTAFPGTIWDSQQTTGVTLVMSSEGLQCHDMFQICLTK
jgi:hypothetical protein